MGTLYPWPEAQLEGGKLRKGTHENIVQNHLNIALLNVF